MNFKNIFSTILIVSLALSLSGCHNLFNKDDEKPTPKYLVDYEMDSSYKPELIQAFFSEIVKENPQAADIIDRIQYGIIVYKIQYKTTFQGKPKLASGLVCMPLGEGTFPMLSYQNGTNTVNANAPSMDPKSELFLLIEAMASTGFVIAIPDYLGFGVSADIPHPYLHKESTVQTVADMLRAAKELAEIKNFSLSNDLYIAGYSQGGWATMQVQKAIEQNYSSEFNLKASAPGGGPYDLSFINEYILAQNTYPMPYYIAYLINSFIEIEKLETPLDLIFNPPYSSLKLSELFDGKHTGGEINMELTTKVADLFTENYRMNFKTAAEFEAIRKMLADNSIEAWKTSIPTRIIHGTADNYIPIEVSRNLHDDFLKKGVSTQQVQLIQIPGADHSGGALAAGVIIIDWFLELTK